MGQSLVGKKEGMISFFDQASRLIPCTVVAVEPNVVVQIKTIEHDGYNAIQLGGIVLKGARKKNLSKPLKGHYKKAQVEGRLSLFEVRVDQVDTYKLGQEITLEGWSAGSWVDVRGKSKGKGFQGVMKRHNFSGGPASHGSGFYRTGGSTGMRSTPGRCLSGTKKPGQMGSEYVTVEGLEIIQVDLERGVVLIKGAIPGPVGATVYLRKSLKKGQAISGKG